MEDLIAKQFELDPTTRLHLGHFMTFLESDWVAMCYPQFWTGPRDHRELIDAYVEWLKEGRPE